MDTFVWKTDVPVYTGYEGERCENTNIRAALIVSMVYFWWVPKCVCNAGYQGILCDSQIPERTQLCPRLFGMVPDVFCNEGYQGTLCDVQRFETVSKDIGMGSRCVCIEGYQGALCDTRVIEQLNCVFGYWDGSRCVCSEGYQGTLCNTRTVEQMNCGQWIFWWNQMCFVCLDGTGTLCNFWYVQS